jgi:hypothetical protein
MGKPFDWPVIVARRQSGTIEEFNPMLTLDLPVEPYWLDLPRGVRVENRLPACSEGLGMLAPKSRTALGYPASNPV